MLWFQSSGSEEPRQRFHIDVRVPPEIAQHRIDAAVAAGGQVVDEAASFVVLADADGNRVCVCS
jgi:4a-hydroxytetrahydrobiopterin dehydratase